MRNSDPLLTKESNTPVPISKWEVVLAAFALQLALY